MKRPRQDEESGSGKKQQITETTTRVDEAPLTDESPPCTNNPHTSPDIVNSPVSLTTSEPVCSKELAKKLLDLQLIQVREEAQIKYMESMGKRVIQKAADGVTYMEEDATATTSSTEGCSDQNQDQQQIMTEQQVVLQPEITSSDLGSQSNSAVVAESSADDQQPPEAD